MLQSGAVLGIDAHGTIIERNVNGEWVNSYEGAMSMGFSKNTLSFAFYFACYVPNKANLYKCMYLKYSK
jgi:hypothetical protein